MSFLVPGLSRDEFVAEAVRHPTEDSFRASPLFRGHGPAIDALLLTPRVERQAGPAAEPPGLLRVVHWNIEKGKKLGGLCRFLTGDPFLRGAHVLTLNEVDLGMARSGPNADVARELARAWPAHSVYLPNYIECTSGLPGEAPPGVPDERSLHGVAVLSRLPIVGVHAHPLPTCWDYFNFREKRFGGRRGLYVLLDAGSRRFIAATAHLEMRCAPGCRARQFAAFLAGLEAAGARWGSELPAILTGDWNTHTFRRGTFKDSLLEFVRIVSTPASRLDDELAWPVSREPLFRRVARAGFDVEGVNTKEPTASQALGTVEDLRFLPPGLGDAVLRLSGLGGRILHMRLDWLGVRGFKPAGAPRTLPAGRDKEDPCSDHAPIGVEVEFL